MLAAFFWAFRLAARRRAIGCTRCLPLSLTQAQTIIGVPSLRAQRSNLISM
jgi:hypothetical protein